MVAEGIHSSAQGTLDEPVRQQTGALGERDEKNAIEEFLREFDRRRQSEFRAIGGTGQKADQPVAQSFIFCIKFVGNVPVGAVGVAQKRVGRAAEQPFGSKDEAQPGVFLRVVELGQIEQFVGVASAPETIEPDLDTVRHQDPP